MNSFYSEEELQHLGFASVGENVLVSKKASIYGAEKITLGNNVRIDDFCILSGKIVIGNYVHVAAYCGLFAGDAGIYLEDFSCLSSRNSVYAISDDYSGSALTNPTVPNEYRNVKEEKVILKRHALVGSGGCILPGVVIGTGVSVAAMSLVNKSLDDWGIYGGVPCRFLKERKKDILLLEKNV